MLWIKGNLQKNSIIVLFFLIITISGIISLRIETGELDKEDIEQQGVSIKSFGAIGDGISDDTEAIERAFNSDEVGDIYFPSGTYKISSTIFVKPGVPRKVIGHSSVIISAKLTSGQNLLVLNRNISFENIEFDFNNGFLQYGLFYKEGLGEIVLKKLKFKNIKDTNSQGGTIVMYILTRGNQVNVNNIHFENMLKKGNGVITDWRGNLTCLFIKGSGENQKAVGHINDVRIKNIHNIDEYNNVIDEDTSGIYVITSESNMKNNIQLRNIYGYNFGKRLIKIDASNVKVKNVFANSNANDTLSAILVDSGSGEKEEGGNSEITDVKIRGKIYIALVAATPNTTFRNIDIKIDKTKLSNGNLTTGVLIMNENVILENAKIEAESPILLKQNSGNNEPIENIQIKNVTFHVRDSEL